MPRDVIAAKFQRLASGSPPTVLDLFAGCGGFSLGFHSAGFRVLGAVELDRHAAATHARNLLPGDPDLHGVPLDITSLDPKKFVRSLIPRRESPRTAVDVIIGGPPCQAFSRVGRAKLREVDDHPEAFLHDDRALLYESYLHFVEKLKPVALVMENVIDIMNHGGFNIPDEMCRVLDRLGYVSRYTTLNAVHYGVPQMRERLFLVALHRSLDQEPSFPKPTHRWDLPKGYDDARHLALQTVEQGATGYILVQGRGRRRSAVTAEEALRDLPPITIHKEGRLRKGPARYASLAPYRSDVEPSSYGRLMRNWSGFRPRDGGVYDHLIRYLPRDYDIFEAMRPGDQYPEAHRLAVERFEAELARRKRKGEDLDEELLRRQMVPGYDASKFPNKWRKMEPDQPARTLMAHLGKDSYTHIHYDSVEKRTISIREAARLQSFPDGFVFCGAMNSAFRQIGNAVPPLMARAVARELRGSLEEAVGSTGHRQMTFCFA